MAVQKDRVTRSRRGMRRSHDALPTEIPVSYDSETGESHLRHHLTKKGFYRGRQVVTVKVKPETQKDEE